MHTHYCELAVCNGDSFNFFSKQSENKMYGMWRCDITAQSVYYRPHSGRWWDAQNSNLKPTGYEPVALTNCASVPYLATPMGHDPTTSAVTGQRSNQLNYGAIFNA